MAASSSVILACHDPPDLNSSHAFLLPVGSREEILVSVDLEVHTKTTIMFLGIWGCCRGTCFGSL